MPYTLSRYSAWEETSITTYLHPASAISRSSSWTSQDSGVVRQAGSSSSPIILRFVPMRPHFSPVVPSRMALMRFVVVVFPEVPVTPTSFMCSAGRPSRFAEVSASPRRVFPVRTQGISDAGCSSQRTQTAPRSAAAPMKAWPSLWYPRTATNRSPGFVFRESQDTPVISISGSAVMDST